MGKKSEETQQQIEQPKVVESIDDVDNVSPEELKDVEETLKSQQNSQTEDIHKSALISQGGNLRTLAEIITDLSRPLPPRHLKKLTKGAAAGSVYIPWPIAVRYMDHFASGWQSEVTVVEGPYGASVTTHTIIPTSDFGKVKRGGVGFEPHVTGKGTEKEKLTGFGGASSIAERMSMKRSFSMFGLGKYLYEK